MERKFLSSNGKASMKNGHSCFRQRLFIVFCFLGCCILTACEGPAYPDQSATASPTRISPTSTTGKTAAPASETATPASVSDGLLLVQERPVCEHSSTAIWQGGSQSTAASSCASGSLALAPVSQHQLAEIDLAKINGKDYSSELTDFEVSADVTQAIAVSLGLQESRTDIWVGFNVQTPAPGYGCGGFIFEVSPLGHWKLEHVDACSHITVLQTGVFSPPAPIFGPCDCSEVKMHVTVSVQNGVLSGWVEGKKVVFVANSFVSSAKMPSVIGLVAEYRTNINLSPTTFTNFQLATGKCVNASTRCSH